MNAIKQIVLQYITHIFLIVLLIFAGKFAYDSYRGKKDLEVKFQDLINTKDKYEQLTKYTAKLESDYKSQADLQAAAQAQWKEVTRSQNERIAALSDATYLIGKKVDLQHGPDYYFATPNKTQNLVLNEVRINGEDSPPIGFVLIKSDGSVYKGNYRFEIEVQQMQTHDEESGKVKVYSKALLKTLDQSYLEKREPSEKQWKGVSYQLPITGGFAEVDPTVRVQEKNFYFWAPRFVGGLNAGVHAGGGLMKPMLGASLMGRGTNKRDLDWRLFQFGVDSDTNFKNFGINFVPFTMRPFPNILSNTYLGPGLGKDANGTNYFLNLSLGF